MRSIRDSYGMAQNKLFIFHAFIGEITMQEKTQTRSDHDESSPPQGSTGDVATTDQHNKTPIAHAVSREMNKDANLADHCDEAKLEELKRQLIDNLLTIKNGEETFKDTEPLKMIIMQNFQEYIKTLGNKFFYGDKSQLIREFNKETGVKERTLRHYIDAAEFSVRNELKITEETTPVIKTVCEVKLEDQDFVLKDSLDQAKAEGLNFPTRKIVKACIKEYRERKEGKVGQKLEMIQNTKDKSKIEDALSTAKLLLDLAINGDEFHLLSMTKTGLDKLVTSLEEHLRTLT